MAATLNAQARSSFFYAQAHKYADTRAAALDEDNIATSVYDELLSTVEKNLPALHEYMALKKSALHLAELHPYDIYLPLTPQGGETFHFTFEEAKATVLEAIKPLGKTYCHDLLLQRAGVPNCWKPGYP